MKALCQARVALSDLISQHTNENVILKIIIFVEIGFNLMINNQLKHVVKVISFLINLASEN